MTTIPGQTWRNIIECSSMANNDERVLHTLRQLTYEEVHEGKVLKLTSNLFNMFDRPRLVLSRPVSPVEIRAGLDTSYRGPLQGYEDEAKGENTPKIQDHAGD